MISCDQHDYIEIACMYRYPLRITMRNGSLITGQAVNTGYNEHRQECMEINVSGGKASVVLEEVSSIQVQVKNPHFDHLVFD